MKNHLRSNSKRKSSDPESSREQKPTQNGYLKYTQVLYLLMGSLVCGIAAGYGLDKLTGFTLPVFKLICSLAGVIVGLYLVYLETKKK